MKLKLVAEPTFKSKVSIPVAGGEPVELEFVFKHRTKAAMIELLKQMQEGEERPDVERFMDFAVGWELEDAFTADNVNLLLENYGGAGIEAFRVYCNQLLPARLGNSAR